MESQQNTAQSSPSARSKRLMWASLAGVAVLALVWAFVAWHMHTASPTISQATMSVGQEGFNPAVATIGVGQGVAITNRDTQSHSLSADPVAMPEFSTDEPLNQGDSYNYTFDKKGKYTFYDPANPSKYTATVVVE